MVSHRESLYSAYKSQSQSLVWFSSLSIWQTFYVFVILEYALQSGLTVFRSFNYHFVPETNIKGHGQREVKHDTRQRQGSNRLKTGCEASLLYALPRNRGPYKVRKETERNETDRNETKQIETNCMERQIDIWASVWEKGSSDMQVRNLFF